MCGPFTLRSKILRRLDETAAEELLPLAVDLNARGQRIIAADEPLRQAEPVARQVLRERRDERRDVRPDLRGFISNPSASAYVVARRLITARLSHDERGDDPEFV